MSVSPVSAGNDLWQKNLLGAIQQRNTDLDSLGASLQTNDLSGAQSAFAALMQDRQQIQGLRQAHGIPTTTAKPVVNDLQALQSALNSGNLSTAKTDLAKLMNDVQQAQKHRHHHGGSHGGSLGGISSLLSDNDGDSDDLMSSATSGFNSIDLQM